MRFTTIGDAPAAGLCGSGLIDALAALLDNGIISPAGRLGDGVIKTLPAALKNRLRSHGNVREFMLADQIAERPVILTQTDIRQVQLAKGAIRAGQEILLKDAGVATESLDAVYLAGALGTHLRAHSVLRLGLTTPVSPVRIHFVGNAALDGATDALFDNEICAAAERLATEIRYVELSLRRDFSDAFTKYVQFP